MEIYNKKLNYYNKNDNDYKIKKYEEKIGGKKLSYNEKEGLIRKINSINDNYIKINYSSTVNKSFINNK